MNYRLPAFVFTFASLLTLPSQGQTDYKLWLSESLHRTWQADLGLMSAIRGEAPPVDAYTKVADRWIVFRVDENAADEVEDRTSGLISMIKSSEPVIHGYAEGWDSADGELFLGVFEICAMPGRLVMRTGSLEDETVRYEPMFQNLYVLGEGEGETNRIVLVRPGREMPWGSGIVQASLSIKEPEFSSLRADPPEDALGSIKTQIEEIKALAEAQNYSALLRLTTHPIKLQNEIEEAQQQGATEDQYFPNTKPKQKC